MALKTIESRYEAGDPRLMPAYSLGEAAHYLRMPEERGWVVLTKDQRLRYRPLEIAAVFLTALPRIFKVLHSVPGPFVARVSQSGHVKIT